MAAMVWGLGIVLLMVLGKVTYAEPIRVSLSALCPRESISDSILGFEDSVCPVNGGDSSDIVDVIEGDAMSLQRALMMLHKSSHEYVAVLFYASWCLFSRGFRPNFAIMSSLYPSIPHFAIEESSIRPSLLSKYGVHGFPTMFLMNSTMRIRYHGPRTLESLVAFYSDGTGIKTVSFDNTTIDRYKVSSNQEKRDNIEQPTCSQESCPFTWARFPVNMLRQETYLALATAFVLLRLLYFVFPSLYAFAEYLWRSTNAIYVHPQTYLARAIHLFKSLAEPFKRSNLQERALNARAWASKSLASVSMSDEHR